MLLAGLATVVVLLLALLVVDNIVPRLLDNHTAKRSVGKCFLIDF